MELAEIEQNIAKTTKFRSAIVGNRDGIAKSGDGIAKDIAIRITVSLDDVLNGVARKGARRRDDLVGDNSHCCQDHRSGYAERELFPAFIPLAAGTGWHRGRFVGSRSLKS